MSPMEFTTAASEQDVIVYVCVYVLATDNNVFSIQTVHRKWATSDDTLDFHAIEIAVEVGESAGGNVIEQASELVLPLLTMC